MNTEVQELAYLDSFLRHAEVQVVTRAGRVITDRFLLRIRDRSISIEARETVPLKEVVALIRRSGNNLPNVHGYVASFADQPLPAMYLQYLIQRRIPVYIWLVTFQWVQGTLLAEFPYSFLVETARGIEVILKHGIILLTPSGEVMRYYSDRRPAHRVLFWIPQRDRIPVGEVARLAFRKSMVQLWVRGVQEPVVARIESFSAHYVITNLYEPDLGGWSPFGIALFMRPYIERLQEAARVGGVAWASRS